MKPYRIAFPIYFIATVKDELNYLGFIPDKELMNISNLELTPLIELKKETKVYHDHKKFFDQIDLVFDTIIDKLIN